MIDLNRRGLLIGTAATLFTASAPAIVRPGLVMPIKARLVPTARRAWVVVRAEWGMEQVHGRPVARAVGHLILMEVTPLPLPRAAFPYPVVLNRSRVLKTLWRTSDYYWNANDPGYPYRAPEQVGLEVEATYAASMSTGQFVEMD